MPKISAGCHPSPALLRNLALPVIRIIKSPRSFCYVHGTASHCSAVLVGYKNRCIPSLPPRRATSSLPNSLHLPIRHCAPPPTWLHSECKSVAKRDTASAASSSPCLRLSPCLTRCFYLQPTASTGTTWSSNSNEELSLSPCEAFSCSLHVRAGAPTGFIICPAQIPQSPILVHAPFEHMAFVSLVQDREPLHHPCLRRRV